MREKRVKQDFWIRGKLLVIEDVPAGVCPQCGERVVRAQVGQAISSLIDNSKRRRAARTMSVPVLRFANKIA
jgi:YgiT-type zinc finger domain-containing protein